MLIDVHAHLNDEELYPRAEEIYGGMKDNNLLAVINAGYDIPSSNLAVELAEKYDKFFSVAGMHPHDSKSMTDEDYDVLAKLAVGKKNLAIGEIGLDYHYDLSPRETQKRVFVEQLRLAHSLKLPAVIHLREAYGDMNELLRENARYTEYGILFHCYGGSKETAAELIKKYDAYFSFGGAVTFKNATEKPDIVRSIPIDRILLETDCPYMTPVPYRGKPNEPKYINLVAEKMAEVLDKSKEEIEEITVNNTKEFFKKINDSL